MTTTERAYLRPPMVREVPIELSPMMKNQWRSIRDRASLTAVTRPDIRDFVSLPWVNGKEHNDIDREAQTQAAKIILEAFSDKNPDTIVGIGNSGLPLAEEVWEQLKKQSPNPSKTARVKIMNQERVVTGSPKTGRIFTARSYSRGKDVSFHLPDIPTGRRALIIDDVSAQGSIGVALIKELQRLGVAVVGFGVYFNKDWQHGLQQVASQTGVPSFSVVMIEKIVHGKIRLVPEDRAICRIKPARFDPAAYPDLSTYRYPVEH